MRANFDFSPMNAGESEVFGFDFAKALPTGDSLVSVVFAMTVLSGVDPSPSSRLNGQSSITGTKALQRVTNPVSGVTYAFEATATTSQGNEIILWAPLVCQPIGMPS